MKSVSRWLLIAIAISGLGLVAVLCLFTVDETEFALVTSFGKVAAILGARPSDAGLHMKAPWQQVIRIDKRIKVFEPAAREMMTGDKRNLEVAAYVVWRVADPSLFLRASGSLALAEARLDERVAAVLSDAVGRRDLAVLASTDPKVWGLDTLAHEVTTTVAGAAAAELGVDVLDVRLRRFQHPLEVRPAVFELIRSERRQVAARIRAEGEAEFVTITSQADRMRDTILAEAEAEARKVRGHAEAEAIRVLNEAHSRDPKFFEFLRTLETYRSIFDGQTTLVLPSSSPLLKLMSQGPATDPPPDSPAGTPPIHKAAEER